MTTVAQRLVEREAELAELSDSLERASSGAGSVVVVEGPAGIGKTSLLGEAAAEAERRSFQVAASRGAELERDNPFGVVRRLLGQVMARLPSSERRKVLSGAGDLAAPLLDSRLHDGPAIAPASGLFPLLHSLYWVCENAAERCPLVIALDDAQWVDQDSLTWCAYLARRLEELPVLLLVALRLGDPGSASLELEEIRSAASSRVLRPRLLSVEGVRLVVFDALGSDLDDAFVRACHDATGGNAFLLRHLVEALADDAVDPRENTPELVHTTRPEEVTRSVRTRLARHSGAAQDLARAVAILEPEAELRHATALFGLDDARGSEAADELAKAGFLQSDRPLRFTHPLLSRAVYEDVPGARRADLHLKAAALLAAEGVEAEGVATQLVHSASRADSWVVDTLRAAAKRVLARGSARSAVTYLRRALLEPPEPKAKSAVLVELGSAEARIGLDEGIEHLREALATMREPRARAAAARELALALNTFGQTPEALETLEGAIDDLGTGDPELALLLEGDLLGFAQLDLETLREVPERLRHRADDVRGDTPGERVLLVYLAVAHVLDGGTVEAASRIAERGLAGGRLLGDQTPDSATFYTAIHLLIDAERYGVIDKALDRAIDDARARGSLLGFGIASTQRSTAAFLRGRIDEAEMEVRGALEAAHDAGWEVGLPITVSCLVDVLVERGELREATEALEGAGMAAECPRLLAFDWLLFSRGRLRLALGDLEAGLSDLFELGDRQRTSGSKPVRTNWRSVAAPALAALGDATGAMELARQELEFAQAVGGSRHRGMALRAMGMATGGAAGVPHLREAVTTLEQSASRLEHARGLIELGAAMRRSNHRSDARAPLMEGLEIAQRCGARALAKRASDELAATGLRLRRSAASGVDALTPSELRVARLAGDGLANREIAQALFVTRKTVEKHLGSAYGKLGIESREQLSAALKAERSSETG